MTRLGNLLMRHANLITFGLIALALLPDAAKAQHAPAGPAVLAAAADPAPNAAAPMWANPQALAGLAALVAALADGVAKVILAARRDVSAGACPFAVGGVARCHGAPTPIPPGNRASSRSTSGQSGTVGGT